MPPSALQDCHMDLCHKGTSKKHVYAHLPTSVSDLLCWYPCSLTLDKAGVAATQARYVRDSHYQACFWRGVGVFLAPCWLISIISCVFSASVLTMNLGCMQAMDLVLSMSSGVVTACRASWTPHPHLLHQSIPPSPNQP